LYTTRDVKAGLTPAFTMIELIFVIVVIGILSAIAIPKLAVTRDDAIVVKGRSQVASIRSGIAMQKNKNLLEGTSVGGTFYPSKLDNLVATDFNATGKKLFYYNDGNKSNILEYPIYSKKDNDGSWVKDSNNGYSIRVGGSDISFDYNSTTGSFDCDHSVQNCKDLTQ